ncbi:hypothetical protein, partial [Megasphaera sp.]|uniref:hypothetical protein n=1 Tax=Megasphaera sp. TaxID=2023260 RepID=UPI003FEDF1FF
GAGRQRRSERLKVGPYAQGRWPYIYFAACILFHQIIRPQKNKPSQEAKIISCDGLFFTVVDNFLAN